MILIVRGLIGVYACSIVTRDETIQHNQRTFKSWIFPLENAVNPTTYRAVFMHCGYLAVEGWTTLKDIKSESYLGA